MAKGCQDFDRVSAQKILATPDPILATPELGLATPLFLVEMDLGLSDNAYLCIHKTRREEIDRFRPSIGPENLANFDPHLANFGGQLANFDLRKSMGRNRSISSL